MADIKFYAMDAWNLLIHWLDHLYNVPIIILTMEEVEPFQSVGARGMCGEWI